MRLRIWTLPAVFLIFSSRLDAANLLTNPDFSLGNSGFSTSYTLASDLVPVGTYAIGSTPIAVDSTTSSNFGDHTTGTGLMLIANGAATVVPAWQETISVLPITQYVFSGWVAAWDSVNIHSPAVLQESVNSSSLGSAFTVQTNAGDWSQFSYPWNSGAATSAQTDIADQNTTGTGNDFVIDDVSFSAVPEPSSFAILGLGFAACAMRIRRRASVRTTPSAYAGN